MAGGFDVCFCGHQRSTHGAQGCIGKIGVGTDAKKCDCDGYIPVLAAIAQSLNTIATHLIDLKNVIAVATNVVQKPNRIIT